MYADFLFVKNVIFLLCAWPQALFSCEKYFVELCMAGGVFLGSAESIAPMVILEPLGVPGVSQLKDAVAFTVLVLVLLFKPAGLFGEKLSQEDRA